MNTPELFARIAGDWIIEEVEIVNTDELFARAATEARIRHTAVEMSAALEPEWWQLRQRWIWKRHGQPADIVATLKEALEAR